MDSGRTSSLADMLGRLKGEWRKERSARLKHKKILMDGGMSVIQVRRDRTYRSMVKRQKGLSVRMRHIVKDLNRRRSKAGDGER